MAVTAGRKSLNKSDGLASNKVRWDKKMSNNCAAALLVYTMLQIFLVLRFIKTEHMSIAPYFGLVLLVGIIIPFCRNFEKRWKRIANTELTEASTAARFRMDQISLWILAIGMPLAFIAIIKLAGAFL